MLVALIHPHFDGQLPLASWPRLAPFLIDCLAEAELAEAVEAVAEVAGLEAVEAVGAVGGGRNLAAAAAAAQGHRQREMADQLGLQEN